MHEIAAFGVSAPSSRQYWSMVPESADVPELTLR